MQIFYITDNETLKISCFLKDTPQNNEKIKF